MPQLREKLQNFETGKKLSQIQIHDSNLKLGLTMMAFGFFKKMFFADNISPLVNTVFSNPMGAESFKIWLGTLAFGIQIYCDFSGYADIAIGTALILGFKIPLNFNKPYFATSPPDFWRRWHISLSSWLRDYLYIPLGGSRKSFGRTYFNLFVVMFLGGLWHGASWNFVVWGLLHGMYLVVHKTLKNLFPNITIYPFFKSRTGKIMSILITQYLIFLTWIPFRVRDTQYMIYPLQKFVLIDFQFEHMRNIISTNKIPIMLMVMFLVLHFISYRKSGLIQTIANFRLRYWGIIIIMILSLIVFFYEGNPEKFIYFQF